MLARPVIGAILVEEVPEGVAEFAGGFVDEVTEDGNQQNSDK